MKMRANGLAWLCGILLATFGVTPLALAAPYAAVIMDARDGKVVYSRNENQVLHPASLTKMMTLYIAFSEIEAGRMSLNQPIVVSKRAAAEPPSKIGLRAGQTIELRYLLRAAAIKSANDASTAICEAIGGSVENFTQYATAVARGLGMHNTTFRNCHGLTEKGHVSTAYDMAILGRRLVYDFPSYYNLFSREYAETPLGNFRNSNTRFLNDYQGADGIKTGYTQAAGYNLVGSAKRGSKRIIVSMFGGASSLQRNQQMGALLDLGFKQTSENVRVANIPKVRLNGVQAVKPAEDSNTQVASVAAFSNKPMRLTRPVARPSLVAGSGGASNSVAEAIAADVAVTGEVVRKDESGDFAIQLAASPNSNAAERQLIAVSLSELESLGSARNQIVKVQMNGAQYYRPRFSGISEAAARRACLSLQSRNEECYIIAPNYGG